MRLKSSWADGVLAVALLAVGLLVAARFPAGRTLDAGGVLLLAATTLPLAVRRSWPLAVFGVHLAAIVPFHALDYQHEAVVPATIVALYTVAARGPRRRTVLVGLATVGFAALGILAFSEDADDPQVVNVVSALGWVVAAVVAGEAMRLHRAYIAEVLDRAERAERSRDEEARRQVAEERLRIARDLHDLLAHSITVIHVEAGVASHLIGDRGVDQAALVKSLDVITGACAEARGELTATLGLLREAVPAGDERLPAPRLAELSALARAAGAAGIEVGFSTRGAARVLPPEVELVAYRIVQEALTNVVKHSGARRAEVVLAYGDDRLGLEVTDDGRGAAVPPGDGFGIGGMTERAAALGGSLTAGPVDGRVRGDGDAAGQGPTRDPGPAGRRPGAGPWCVRVPGRLGGGHGGGRRGRHRRRGGGAGPVRTRRRGGDGSPDAGARRDRGDRPDRRRRGPGRGPGAGADDVRHRRQRGGRTAGRRQRVPGEGHPARPSCWTRSAPSPPGTRCSRPGRRHRCWPGSGPCRSRGRWCRWIG